PTATTPTGTAPGSEPVPTNPGGTLGKDGFLKLMVAQLQAQDPLQPTESSAYVGELAQFTELEQVTNLAQTASQSATAQQVAQAVALIGHTVSYKDSTGATVQGTVQNVNITSAGATLTVEGHSGIEPAGITEIS
ncbi:MAG: flagellar hook capping FlgD N-terminal domain-containing protein, partial [Solirubrobacterales bacterium]